jgi:hypothetical protein
MPPLTAQRKDSMISTKLKYQRDTRTKIINTLENIRDSIDELIDLMGELKELEQTKKELDRRGY